MLGVRQQPHSGALRRREQEPSTPSMAHQWLTFIDEDQPFQHVGHVGLALFNPDPSRLGHVGAQLFAGEQRFFYG